MIFWGSKLFYIKQIVFLGLISTLLACASSNSSTGTITPDGESVGSRQKSAATNSVTPSGLNSSNLTARLLSRDGVLKTNSVSLASVSLGKNATDISQELAGQILADSAHDKIDFEIKIKNVEWEIYRYIRCSRKHF